MPTCGLVIMVAMLVGVIDVGSNTVRLVVTRDEETVLQRRALVRLGEGIERTGSISELKLAETAHTVATSPSSRASRAQCESRCS